MVAPLETEPEAEPVDEDGDAAADLRVEPSVADVVAAGHSVDARVGELEAANEANEAPFDVPIEEAETRGERGVERGRPRRGRPRRARPMRICGAADPGGGASGECGRSVRRHSGLAGGWHGRACGVRGRHAGCPGGGRGAAAEEQAEAERWDRIAEEVRMQVLQRIDLFTDTGLQEQLARRLQPIVDRASGELVTAINQHVGQLMRAYVAEAIEREIEKWRAGGL